MDFDLKIVLNDAIRKWSIRRAGVRGRREQQELHSDLKSRNRKTVAVRR